MKESYMEDIASHHGPRSCARPSSPPPPAARVKGLGEVSLNRGESVSWVLSSESIKSGMPAYLLCGIGHASRAARTRGAR